MYYLLVIRYEKNPEELHWRFEIPVYVMATSVPLTIATTGVIIDGYRPRVLAEICFITSCGSSDLEETGSCPEKKAAEVLIRIYMLVVAGIAIASCIATTLVYLTVRKRVQTIVDPSLFQNVDPEVARNRLRWIGSQAVAYTFNYLNTLLWQSILFFLSSDPVRAHTNLQGKSWVYVLQMLCWFFIPLQGLFNCLVYSRPKYLRWKQQRPTANWLFLHWQAFQMKDPPRGKDDGNSNDGSSGSPKSDVEEALSAAVVPPGWSHMSSITVSQMPQSTTTESHVNTPFDTATTAPQEYDIPLAGSSWMREGREYDGSSMASSSHAPSASDDFLIALKDQIGDNNCQLSRRVRSQLCIQPATNFNSSYSGSTESPLPLSTTDPRDTTHLSHLTLSSKSTSSLDSSPILVSLDSAEMARFLASMPCDSLVRRRRCIGDESVESSLPNLAQGEDDYEDRRDTTYTSSKTIESHEESTISDITISLKPDELQRLLASLPKDSIVTSGSMDGKDGAEQQRRGRIAPRRRPRKPGTNTGRGNRDAIQISLPLQFTTHQTTDEASQEAMTSSSSLLTSLDSKVVADILATMPRDSIATKV